MHFHQLERGTSDRIRYRRVNERTGREVEYADIVKARDVGDGAYVVVEQQELADIAPGRSRSIDVTTFVDLDEIDPIFFQKTYWLAPTEEQYGHAYGLLRHALAKTNRAGIATFVMRGKEYLTAVRVAQEPRGATEVADLLDALRRSVESARAGRKPPRDATPQDSGPDLSTLRKTELQAMARELDVPGRSTMTRAELEDAVAKAGPSPGSRHAS